MHYNWRKLRDPSQEKGDNRAWRAELTVLVQENDELREDGRRCCKTNLLALCYTLGYCLITEDVHHEAIAFFPEKDPSKTVEQLSEGVTRRNSLLYPRGAYKTTLDIANIIQYILFYYFTIAILILSASKKLAFALVDEISGHFYKPKNRPPTLFQALFPELCVDLEPERGAFTAALRQREPTIKEPMLWANSLGSSTTGWHPDLLIVDDVHDNRNSEDYEARKKIAKRYKLTRKILKPTGIELKLGTCYGPGDVFAEEVLNSRPGTYTRVYKPAMRLRNGERLDPNGFPDEADVELLFPTILAYDYLREEYESDYESFMSQLMLDTYGSAEVVFSESQMLTAMIEADKLPVEGETFIHWRLECRKMRWKTTNAAVGIRHRNRMYIAEVMHGHFKPSELARMIVASARKYGLHEVSIEESPGARLMQPTIQNYALTVGWDVHINWTPFIEDSGERDIQIRNIEADIASSRLLFSNGIVKLKPLIQGFVQYGMIDETGLPDVVAQVAGNLPQSIAAEGHDEESAWDMMRERDKYNMIYGRGAYARPEPEPEEVAIEEPRIEDQELTGQGLETWIPGLE
jgi:hypothetical protein